jgi:DNA polymerase III delta prime subunit
MFYNSDEELKNLILNSGTSIILEKDAEKLKNLFKNAIIVEDQTADGIQNIISMTTTKADSPRIFIFKDAEKLNIICQNRILKLLEEPKENYHFVLQTNEANALLQTIRSRAFIYAPHRINTLDLPPEAEKDVFELSKRLLIADTPKTIEIADGIMKKKFKESTERRAYVLEVLKITIELAEKSYFKTKNEAFTKKINGLITAHKNISENGNIRLQLVANLV